ncbi:EscU/YscU/HrcU family type III secretion system export apparatus switch protein [Herbivorax sp. ANBcel31]|uniref:EscU/YscU/HrcU family type III secretion system export apparatus switch protein n=1 Tax=Herbivorax sp. ANBcel31 TaxID=3069754 RepID=UPI0027B1F106|nr:EscU/YscU/HrcU family type III secretion system export apparatus switch protein [Herbivorax sp. ANBcel31]MDQ2087203.1 EscU/YscU/HrcU family type III secretion system export apparatus switch protein [Herbivorax sp. ANBcel31]
MKEKKKIKQVAALKYSPDKNDAPEIIGLGKGEIAEKIIEKANQSDVPLYENEELATTLNTFNIGDEIPPELYEVVAGIFSFIKSLDKKYGERK